MGFRELEQRCNSAIKSRLSNREATIDGAANKQVIFNKDYFESGIGVGFETSEPTIDCDDADVVGVTQGDAIIVDAISYTVAEVMPDGTGRTMLRLKK